MNNKLSLVLETPISSTYAWGWSWKKVLKKKTLERNSLVLGKSSVMNYSGLGLLFWPQRCVLSCQQPSRQLDMVRRGRNKETVKKRKNLKG